MLCADTAQETEREQRSTHKDDLFASVWFYPLTVSTFTRRIRDRRVAKKNDGNRTAVHGPGMSAGERTGNTGTSACLASSNLWRPFVTICVSQQDTNTKTSKTEGVNSRKQAALH